MSALPSRPARVALLYPGDRAARDASDPSLSRFTSLFDALAAAGVEAEPAVYHDDFAPEVEAQLRGVECVLVWCNPVHDGRRRDRLDAMLRRLAAIGVQVSADPDTILRLGTKDVLVATRDLPFGSDVHRIDSLEQLERELPGRLSVGPRVLKQHRGHSGIGVWRVERRRGSGRPMLRVRHARRGDDEAEMDLPAFLRCVEAYFQPENGGHMIDQAWQPRLVDGMVRAYLVEDRVCGFGHQAINALYPAHGDEPAPMPGPRLYSGPDDTRFQPLKLQLESRWIGMLRERTGVLPERLPLLWDCDFLPGPANSGKEHDEEGGFVLCEVNVSSVSPFPPSCVAPLVAAVVRRLGRAPRQCGGAAFGSM